MHRTARTPSSLAKQAIAAAGCTALLEAHQAAVSNYPKIRPQFARSYWPDLRTAGTAYVDLAIALRTARADGYQTVWFYQRLSVACAKHGWRQASFLRAG